MEEPLKTPDKGYGSSCLTQTTSIKTNAFFVDSFETTCLPGQLQQGTVFVPLQKLVSSMRRVFPRLHRKGQLQSVGKKTNPSLNSKEWQPSPRTSDSWAVCPLL